MFYNIFTPIADMVNIEHMERVFEDVDYTGIMSKLEEKKTRYGYEWHERKCCDSLFMRMNINADGGVDACGCQQPALSIGPVSLVSTNSLLPVTSVVLSSILATFTSDEL